MTSTEVTYLPPEVAPENAGELLLLGYADFLRRYNAAVKLSEQLRKRADDARDSFLQMAPLTIKGGDLASLSNEAIAGYKCDEITGWLAARSVLYAARADEVVEATAGQLYPHKIVDEARGTTIAFPRGVVLDVEARENEAEIQVLNDRGEVTGNFVHHVGGTILRADFTEEGGVVLMRNDRGRQYMVEPLIDVKNYTSPWIIRYQNTD